MEALLRNYAEKKASGAYDNVEFEIRLSDVTSDLLRDVFVAASEKLGAGTLSTTINFISTNVFENGNNQTQYICTLEYANGKRTDTRYTAKERLYNPLHINEYMRYRIGISAETPIEHISTKRDALVRFKIRVSFDLPYGKDKWRLDLTIVRSGVYRNVEPKLAEIRDSMFKRGQTAAKFADYIGLGNEFEIELEFISGGTPDMSVTKELFGLVDSAWINTIDYQDQLYAAALAIGVPDPHKFKSPNNRLKRLLPQVISVSKFTYGKLVAPAESYFATIKADGQRALLYITGGLLQVFLADVKYEFGTNSPAELAAAIDTVGGECYIGDISGGSTHVSGTNVSGSRGSGNSSRVTIMDCELFAEEGNEFTITSILVFDIIILDDEKLYGGIEERIPRLAEGCAIANKIFDGEICTPKKYVNVRKATRRTDLMKLGKSAFASDGIVIAMPGHNYIDTACYKWKPFEQNTIDFIAIKCPDIMMGVAPYIVRPGETLYLLFVGISHNMRKDLGIGLLPQYNTIFPDVPGDYYPVQFSPSIDPLAYLYYSDNPDLNGLIVELNRDRPGGTASWNLQKIRNDRKLERTYYGNDFKVAEITYMNFIAVFEQEDLYLPSTAYFGVEVPAAYVPANRFKREVITKLIKDEFTGAPWIVDLCCGRGADLRRLQAAGVKQLLMTDIDPTAITELIERKFSARGNRKKIMGAGDMVSVYDRFPQVDATKLITAINGATVLHTMVADLKQPYMDTFAGMYRFGVRNNIIDGVLCNFALHYFCDTLDHLKNFMQLVSALLRPNGIFMFTVMDGEKVFAALKEATGSLTYTENNAIKYQIVQKYKSTAKIADVGQIIAVKLPFAEEMREEPLCNLAKVITVAAAHGLKIEKRDSMITYLAGYDRANNRTDGALTPIDIEYTELHSYVTMRRDTTGVKK